MSQHDYDIANGGGASVRADINLALAAIQSQNSGASAPTATKPFMPWYDTSTGALKFRNATDTAWLSAPEAVGGSQGLMFRNRIINGDMRIDQRNAGAAISAASGSGNYAVDRFAYNASQTGKFNLQQNAGSVTPPTGFTNYLGATVAAAYTVTSTDYFILETRIEGLNIADLGWGAAGAQAVTLSFKVRSSLTGTFGGSLTNGVNASYPFTYSIASANTWTDVTITVPGPTTGTWLTTNGLGLRVVFGLGVGPTLAGAAGSWSASALVGATGAVSVVGTNAATFYITGVQLEAGSVATPFERRPYGTELLLASRYFQVLQSAFAGQSTSGIGFGANLGFPVQMRASPTMAFVSSSAAVNFPATAGAFNNVSAYGLSYEKLASGTGGSRFVDILSASAEL